MSATTRVSLSLGGVTTSTVEQGGTTAASSTRDGESVVELGGVPGRKGDKGDKGDQGDPGPVPIHVGPTPPADTSLLWLDTSV